MQRIHLVVLISLVSILSCAAAPASQRREVSVKEAENLVAAGLPANTRELPKFNVVGHTEPEHPDFYVLWASWAGAPNGSLSIGYYHVDKATGEVWSATAQCVLIDTPDLRALQTEIRRQIGLTDSEYLKIRKNAPMCPSDVNIR
jgi:hypothetical protein